MFCGVTYGAVLFAYVHKKYARRIWVNNISASKQTEFHMTHVISSDWYIKTCLVESGRLACTYNFLNFILNGYVLLQFSSK